MRARALRSTFLAIALAVAMLPAATAAAPGDPRPGFGSGGVAPFTFGLSGTQRIARIVVTPTGIVAVGSVNDLVVRARLTEAGALDAAYPNGPLAFPNGTQLQPIPFGPADAALRPGGGIAITAQGPDLFFIQASDPYRSVLYELNPAGFIEFGFNSVVGLLVNGEVPISGAIAMQNDGRELVIGTLSGGPGGAFRMVVVRQDRPLNLDISFGLNGIVDLDATGSSGVIIKLGRALALQPDGKIVAVGVLGAGSSTSLVVGRFTTSGAVDTSFAGDGVQHLTVPAFPATGYVNTHVLPSGRVLVVTSSTIVALTAAGELDASFGVGGTLTPAGPIVHSVISPLGGLYVLTGAAVTAYTSDGQLDASFGSGGVTTLQRAGATAIALHPDGDLLVGSPDGTGVAIERIEGPQIYRLSIADAAIVEGSSGDRTVSVVVSLDRPSDAPVSATWATAAGTAAAGTDYRSASGSVTIAAGQTTATIQAAVIGDILGETDEFFRITLSSPVGAIISDGTAIVTIRNDDDRIPPVIAAKPTVVVEAATAPVAVVYTAPTATDRNDGAVTPVCSPRSGASFGFGTTRVTCTATDRNGNAAASTFDVIVRQPTSVGAVTDPRDLDHALTTAAPGQKVRVTAGGFAPGSKVRLVIRTAGDGVSVLDSAKAGPDGRIDVRTKIPKTARAGAAEVVATGTTGAQELVRVWALEITVVRKPGAGHGHADLSGGRPIRR